MGKADASKPQSLLADSNAKVDELKGLEGSEDGAPLKNRYAEENEPFHEEENTEIEDFMRYYQDIKDEVQSLDLIE